MHDRSEVILRLRLIEGQIRSIQRMVEEGHYFVDVLNQLAAARAAMTSVSQVLLEEHTRTCVQQAIRSGKGDEAIDDLLQVIAHAI